jgi:eukaryotic-like serine/threonine-protein kinase
VVDRSLPPASTIASGPPSAVQREDLPLIGDRYRVLGMLGGGGMGNVYLAYDLELDEHVAVKVLKASLSRRPEQLDMLRREVKFARRVTHPNVLRTFDIGTHEGGKFFTMELVEGQTLSDLLPRKMHLAEVLRIAHAVCAGLGAAHDAGVVHRDLKPSNVLLATGGRILLSDFGIARLADDPAAGSFAGTPGYMAPELLAGEPVDARADIWALGVLLYELCTGTRPYPAAKAEIPRPLLDDAADPLQLRPELPLPLARVVTRCLARQPQARFAHPREVAAALDAALPAPGRERGSASLTLARRARVLAVLPLENLGSADDSHVAEGLTALLRDSLDSQRLRVPSRGAVDAVGVTGRDPVAVGRELGAEAVVTGSVARDGAGVVIELRVVGTGDGLVLFKERLARPGAEIVRAAEEASRSIAGALLVERTGAAAPLRDADAIDLYLKALQEFRRRWEPSVVRALGHFRQALEHAPDDPMILSAYALALARRLSFGGTADDVALARAVSAQALSLAPDRPDPLVAVASVALHLGDAARAARSLVAALQLAPHHAEAHHLRGLLAFEVVSAPEGLAHLYTATTIDPTMTHARWWIARGHALLGESARADALFAAPVHDDQGGNDYWVSRMRALLYDPTPERCARFLADFEVAPEFDTKRAVAATLPLIRGEPVATGDLAMLVDPNENVSRRRAFSLAAIKAEISAVAGDADEVLRAIGQADAAGFVDVVWLDCCPLLEPVRSHGDFAAVRARVAARAAPVRAILDEAKR